MYWTGPANPGDVRGSTDVKVWVQPVSGGAAIQIGAGCSLFENTSVWSPDSTRILFIGSCGREVLARQSGTENLGLTAWVSTADGKVLTPNRDLYSLWRTIHYPPRIDQWIDDPPRLLIPMLVGDTMHIISVPVSSDGTRVTGAPHRLTYGSGNETRAVASLSGRITLSTDTWESHIWTLPIDTDGKVAGAPKQVTFGPTEESPGALSRDGKKLSFSSVRMNGVRLFYKDLATARQKEISTEGYRYEAPVFSHDGTRIMCAKYPSPENSRDFIYEIPLSGGVSRKIWDQATWSLLWDWAPDDSTLLIWTDFDKPSIEELDLKSLSKTTFLSDPEYKLYQSRFSGDGRWVTFNAIKDLHSRIYVAPFRKASVPRNEWIPITDGTSDEKPHFSHNDKLIFFTSVRDGFRCIWAQKLSPEMRPTGAAFAVYHYHQRRNSLENGPGGTEIAVGPNSILFSKAQAKGNIWLLEPAKAGTK